jgi:hypothetical protein
MRHRRYRSDGVINLVEQGTDLRAVIDIIGGQRRRDDPAPIGLSCDLFIRSLAYQLNFA